ncbi:MAG TPA: LysR substrate-binding domain-containing protein [Thermoanaerobaculia bacterium]|nr:LysR substrate-binding domain-containing protein [Thermoanaerobaculia bacterium]
MSYRFSLRQLEYAVALADTLNFRTAAERCNVSQPSLSAQIAQLEAAIGVRLFERDRRHVLVTSHGAEVIAGARVLLRHADDVETAARLAADPLGATMRIGIIPTISPYLLPRIAPALRRNYPRLRVRWTEERTAALASQLKSGAIDAMLVAKEAQLGDVDMEEIARDRFLLAAARTHPLARESQPLRAAELRGEDVLLLEDGHCFRDQALAICARAKAHELEFRATSLATLVQMVAGGDAVTLLPELAVSVEARNLKIREFADPAPHRTIVLAWRKSSPMKKALRAICATLRAA